MGVKLIVACHEYLQYESAWFLFFEIPQTKYWMWFLLQNDTDVII